MGLREEIAEKIYLSYSPKMTFQESNKAGYNNSDCYDLADRIISQVTLPNWIVEEKCPGKGCDDGYIEDADTGGSSLMRPCPVCQGKGIITRPAKLEDLEREDVKLRRDE